MWNSNEKSPSDKILLATNGGKDIFRRYLVTRWTVRRRSLTLTETTCVLRAVSTGSTVPPGTGMCSMISATLHGLVTPLTSWPRLAI